jgi:hypothetical protein
MMVEATCSSKTLVGLPTIIWRYIPEDETHSPAYILPPDYPTITDEYRNYSDYFISSERILRVVVRDAQITICTTIVNNFVNCGFVAPYYKILTYTYTYPYPPSK